MADTVVTKITTGEVRLSYCSLFKPRTPKDGGDPKYTATLLIPKTDVATLTRIRTAIDAAKGEGKNKCWNGTIPPVISVPLHDGDAGRPSDGLPFGDECKGCYVLSANAKSQPPVVDGALSKIIDETQVYSGIYANVGISFYPYNVNGKKGVGCGLDGVQKTRDGEPLGGQRSVEQMFAPVQGAVDPITGQPV